MPKESIPSWVGNCRPGCEVAVLRLVVGRGAREQLARVEADFGQHEERQQDAGGHQDHGLDDLHPRRGEHAAEDHVGEHERADDHDRRGEGDADERLDQHARADHLRDEVDEQHGQRAERRGRAGGPLAQPEREHVGERVLARVAHPLGEEEQHGQEGDERGHQAHERVDAEEEHEAGEAEERGRRTCSRPRSPSRSARR